MNNTYTFNECGFDGLLGGHWECMGRNSGEEYFEKFFIKEFKKAIDEDFYIYFTDKHCCGVPPSFINTLIELTIETYGVEIVEERIKGFNSKTSQSISRNKQIKDTIEFYKTQSKDYKNPRNLKYCKRYNKD